jgi:hypothetical protein
VCRSYSGSAEPSAFERAAFTTAPQPGLVGTLTRTRQEVTA